MTKEEKELLLKDLCARLPYKIMGEYSWKCGNPYKRELTGNLMAELINSFNSTGDSEFNPYLRPMLSMTEEEKDELCTSIDWVVKIDKNCNLVADGYSKIYPSDYIDWLNAHYFDYRGLIKKGLALEAPEGMYKID